MWLIVEYFEFGPHECSSKHHLPCHFRSNTNLTLNSFEERRSTSVLKLITALVTSLTLVITHVWEVIIVRNHPTSHVRRFTLHHHSGSTVPVAQSPHDVNTSHIWGIQVITLYVAKPVVISHSNQEVFRTRVLQYCMYLLVLYISCWHYVQVLRPMC